MPVVVITGAAARSASARTCGVAEHYVGKPTEYWKSFGAFKDMHDRLREIGKPTLARMNGIASAAATSSRWCATSR